MTTNNPRKIAIYARVSLIDKDQNPDNQLHVLRQWAISLGADIVDEYVDFADGGNSNRPAFYRMRMDARQNKFEGIVVWSLDRFSREGILNTMEYLRDLGRYNVYLKAYNDTWLNTSDPMTKDLLLSIFSWVASFEKKRISDRIKADIARRKALGIYKGGRPKKVKNEEVV
jgi:DNA invertase Pin-like site-specific DNA recombinase